MVGAFAIALLGVAVARAVQLLLAATLVPLVERPYEAMLRVTRLPRSVFPQQEEK
jgi:undecaprenyl-diphosphatase